MLPAPAGRADGEGVGRAAATTTTTGPTATTGPGERSGGRATEGTDARATDPRASRPAGSPPPTDASAGEARTVLSVPALGLTTEVAEVDPVGGTIDPPTFDRAYRIAPYGTPGSDNTTYIAGHSWNAGDAVFNPLLDVASQQATLQPGDVVDVVQDDRTFSYRVESTARYPKGTLADVDEVWQRVPGRLVLITCFQLDTGARSRDNLVVTAQLVEPPGPGA